MAKTSKSIRKLTDLAVRIPTGNEEIKLCQVRTSRRGVPYLFVVNHTSDIVTVAWFHRRQIYRVFTPGPKVNGEPEQVRSDFHDLDNCVMFIECWFGACKRDGPRTIARDHLPLVKVGQGEYSRSYG